MIRKCWMLNDDVHVHPCGNGVICGLNGKEIYNVRTDTGFAGFYYK